MSNDVYWKDVEKNVQPYWPSWFRPLRRSYFLPAVKMRLEYQPLLVPMRLLLFDLYQNLLVRFHTSGFLKAFQDVLFFLLFCFFFLGMLGFAEVNFFLH